ncbi:hypothetical protein [Aquimarina sp. AU119]|uniref:hypothetical protein n=1 Tax=Aquimarina sp. AU119 TaxID=2108528 RepID=UPI000D68AA8A|nr:hypothetical protein [Aquimarina sp. AU119]
MINREAKDLIEAIRLQKLRALEYLLDHLEDKGESDIAVAIEILEDVYVRKEKSEMFEQNKNYDPSSKFSLNSEEILKSFCSFLDVWVYNQLSTNISFCFLSTNSIAKERQTERSRNLKINFPSEKILEVLATGNDEKIKEVSCFVKSIVTDYYQKNFIDETSTLNVLDSMDLDSWNGFLSQIKWIFGYKSVEEINKSLIEKIKNCRYYSKFHHGKEEDIKAKLLEVIEQKSIKEDYVFRLVNKSDIKLQFSYSELENQNLTQDDVYLLWTTIEKPDDFRNLGEKILAVCPSYNSKKLKNLERKASIAKIEENKLRNSPKYLALKYRVYDYCANALLDMIDGKSTFTEAEINIIISAIDKECVEQFKELKKDFDYGIKRNTIILELFVEFIDSCYLAFD